MTLVGNRVLVIILCETRAAELTANSFFAHAVEPLGADLALCVRTGEERNTFYKRATYVWLCPEPSDWNTAFDDEAGHQRWETLLDLHEMFLGPLGRAGKNNVNVGSGAIGLFYRRFLKSKLRELGLLDRYDWFIVTRSDFMWPMAHPPVDLLRRDRIYALDGEHYGGICDRHIVVPRKFIDRYLELVDPIFDAPETLRADLEIRMRRHRWDFMNPERFHAARMADVGLWRRVRFLPYVPFTVRAPGGSTRWSKGTFDEQKGYYIKYPRELQRSNIAAEHIRVARDWSCYLRGLNGARRRYRLRRAYDVVADFSDERMPRIGDPQTWRSSLRSVRARARVPFTRLYRRVSRG